MSSLPPITGIGSGGCSDTRRDVGHRGAVMSRAWTMRRSCAGPTLENGKHLIGVRGCSRVSASMPVVSGAKDGFVGDARLVRCGATVVSLLLLPGGLEARRFLLVEPRALNRGLPGQVIE